MRDMRRQGRSSAKPHPRSCDKRPEHEASQSEWDELAAIEKACESIFDQTSSVRELELPLDALIELAEESAPGEGGEEWRRWSREAERERDVG